MKSLQTALKDMVNSSIKAFTSRMHICVPAMVFSYDKKTNTASVYPVSGVELAGENQMPMIHNVVVAFSGTSRHQFYYEIKKGDHVLLHFCDVSIQNWLYYQYVGWPDSARRFNINDCYAMPCTTIREKKQLLPTDCNSILDVDGSAIEFKKTGKITINGHLEVLG